MEKFLRNISIRNKLVFLQVVTALIATIIVLAIGYTNAYNKVHLNQIESTSVLADFLGTTNEVALAMNMSASTDFNRFNIALARQENIMNVQIFNVRGENFYTYIKKKATPFEFDISLFPEKNKEGVYFKETGFINYYHSPILDSADGSIIGYVCFRTNRDREEALFAEFVRNGIVISMACFFLILFLSSYLQKSVSGPIQRLIDVIKTITESRNYQTRVNAIGTDEVSILSNEFDNLITEVRKRDVELQNNNTRLETTVAERTLKLSQAYGVLEKRTKELEIKNRELEQFAYIASHDLQEPLRSIGSFSQLLKRRYSDVLEGDGATYLGFLVGGVQRMKDVIEDILAFSRLDRSRENFVPINFDAIIEHVNVALLAAIEDANAEIKFDFPTNKTVHADQSQLKNLFQNLISNGIKFTPKEGVRRPIIEIGCEELDTKWKFSVKDNGIGIEDEYKEKIFRIFQRLHNKETYPGTGIGLAICKKIVDHHNGMLWFESEVGKGTTF